ncbi:hypothetical protein AB0M36_17150 [Actinoplanes sp. NPDC051346]|uniref:hypothetical protein n=1 Tax=Actinoplanes sp. NPDC051346 TaxID=3155048 RepID=UPI00341E304D
MTITQNGQASFRLRRGSLSGPVSDVHPLVKGHLEQLNTLLGKRVFADRDPASSADGAAGDASKAAGTTGAASRSGAGGTASAGLLFRATIDAMLTPHRPGRVSWEPKSLASRLDLAHEDDPGKLTVADVVDLSPEIAQLSYEFDELLNSRWSELSFNQRAVLDPDYPGIRKYLVAFGYLVKNLKTAPSLLSFCTRNSRGASKISEYAILSAARSWIHDENLDVAYLKDDAEVMDDLRAADLSCSADAFVPGVRLVVQSHLNDGRYEKLLDAHKDLYPSMYRLPLIQYLKRAPVTVTAANIAYYIPLYVSQIAGGVDFDDQVPTREASDQDFEVDFFTEDRSTIQVSRSAVKCAAQLYYTMILGDELRVFDVANYFTHKHLVRQGFEITDPRLRRDLQMYVFSNQFTVVDAGTNTNRLVDRTQPAERQMFYRQVFNQGGGQVTEDIVVNEEFPRLWKVLMLESARYLERAQISPNPTSYVSRQNVMQAVEDVQYNLSLHCTGMATVMTPLIYDELNFVTRRILMHDEVRRQLAPGGGSWWTVVEALHLGMSRARPRATVLNNKARLGHNILRAIADYDAATFDEDTTFSRFIGDVEAFITTQSILQESLKEDLMEDEADVDADAPEDERGLAPGVPGLPAAAPVGEWDF